MKRVFLSIAALVLMAGVCVGYPAASTDVGITAGQCPDWAGTKTNTSGRTISTPGTTISYEEITGQLTINAANVTIQCVKINATGLYGITCGSSACDNTLMEDSEILNCAGSACMLLSSPSGGPSTFRRMYVHNATNDLIKIGGYVTLSEIYAADFTPAPGAHNDAIQSVSGTNMNLLDSNIQGPFQAQTSAWIIKSDSGAISNVKLSGNRLSGGSYTLYLRDGGFGAPQNVTVENNVWVVDSSQFGAVSSDMVASDCLKWVGNTLSTGASLGSPTGAPQVCECSFP